MNKNTKIISILIIIVLALAIYFISTSQSQTDSIKTKITSNLENAKYLKIDTENKVFYNETETAITANSKYDYEGDKYELHTTSEIGEESTSQDYYRINTTSYRNNKGTWKTDRVAPSSTLYTWLEVLARIKKVEKFVPSQDKTHFTSQIPENDSIKIVNSLFASGIIPATEDIVISNAKTDWFISQETNQLQTDVRTIEAEINGLPVQIVMKNSYRDYNVPLEIEIPQEALETN